MKKYYIAYGSNMHLGQMAYRCPNATVHTTGILKGWRLVFRGSKTGAYATVEKCDNCNVPVVIWEITQQCERALDIYEGYPVFYQKKSVIAHTRSGSLRGTLYVMDSHCLPGRPSHHYVETVRQGYIDNNINTSTLTQALTYNEYECS